MLNKAPGYFDGGLIQMNNPGTFSYMSTRNNQFSNRSQKGMIVVNPNWPLIAGTLLTRSPLVSLRLVSLTGRGWRERQVRWADRWAVWWRWWWRWQS